MKMIKTNDSKYDEYEQLLLERDQVRKAGIQAKISYMRRFGQLITDVFKQKIECIKRKKTIAYYQQMINRGEKIDPEKVKRMIKQEMAEYFAELRRLTEELKLSKESKRCSDYDVKRSKELYRRIAKLIHPDINPETDRHEELRGLWTRAQIAYNANNVKELSEVEVLVRKTLKELGLGADRVDVPDIDERIEELKKEIERIKTTAPFTYQYILEDEESVAEKEKELQDEMDAYKQYIEQLDETINALILEGGVVIQWQRS